MNTEPAPSTRPAAAVAVWLAIAYIWLADNVRAVGRRLADDTGVEDSPSKLIFLAVAVAIAIAAGLFIISVFNDAQSNVPDPVAPSPEPLAVTSAVLVTSMPGSPGAGATKRRLRGDAGVVDAGLETLFGGVALIAIVLLLVETVSFWHARNVFDEAAAEGARVAAAFDGSCATGTSTAEELIARRAGGWSSGVAVSCSEVDGTVTVTVSGTTPGVLFDAAGFTASVTESAPKER